MASPSTSALHHHGKSHFLPTVCLVDWWLIKAEIEVQSRRLAIAGITHRAKQAMRVFTSAPILKRYDDFTLETTDAIHVILDGFINKARTLESGFPSEVVDHFVFGFPPDWKEYEEKFMAREGPQPHVASCEKDFSSQGKIVSKPECPSNQAKSLAVASPKKPSTGRLHKESYTRGTSLEDHTAAELPVNCLKQNNVKSLSDQSCDGSLKKPVVDENANYSQISGSGGTLSECPLNKKRIEWELDNLRKMDSKKVKTNSEGDISSSQQILNCNEEKVMNRQIRTLKMDRMNNQRSTGIADCEKVRLNSLLSIGCEDVGFEPIVDLEPGNSNNCSSEAIALHITKDNIEPSLSNAAPIEHRLEKIPETCDKGLRKTKTLSKTLKAQTKPTELPHTPATPTKSHHTSAAVSNQLDTVITGKYSLSKKAKALDAATRRRSERVSKIRLNSISSIGSGSGEFELDVDRELDSSNNCSSDDSGLHRTTDDIETCLPAAAFLGKIKTLSKTREAQKKATGSPCTPPVPTKTDHAPAAIHAQMDTVITVKDSVSKKAKALDMATRRKSASVSKETSERKTEQGWSASPQSRSFKRSRSGRLLMPILEFWRNQRATYDVDGTIIGFEEGMSP